MLGKIGAVDLDHCQIGKWVGADQFGGQDSTIAERDFDFGSAIDHVIVGDDVAVGRNDDTAADAVLDPRLLRLHALAKLLAKESLYLIGNAFGHGLGLVTREVTATFTMAGVTRAATASIA